MRLKFTWKCKKPKLVKTLEKEEQNGKTYLRYRCDQHVCSSSLLMFCVVMWIPIMCQDGSWGFPMWEMSLDYYFSGGGFIPIHKLIYQFSTHETLHFCQANGPRAFTVTERYTEDYQLSEELNVSPGLSSIPRRNAS